MFKFLIFLLLLCTFSFEAWSVTTGLYLKDGTSFNVDNADKAMSELVEKYNTKKILIFVHGRGKHPKKGLGIISTIEEKYNVKVIMFHWDSWIDNSTRPVQNALDASDDLFISLRKIDDYRKRNMSLMKDVKISLLTHSMGSFVLQGMLKNYRAYSLPYGLIENIVINQGDSLVSRHDEWLSKCDFQKSLYVTYNKNDFVLHRSMKIDPGQRLGLGIERDFRPFYELSPNANYIDLTNVVKKKHRTYILSTQKKYKDVLNFYTKALESDPITLSPVSQLFRKWASLNAFEFRSVKNQ